ncbi:unnamed protein product [Paramecium octaurelia]|uniref:Transmembrane protein n=1 Tax=Paramecium octaurelia TaxID=43137 RepID=A0A8S1XFZ1_PAROT|nr:unnamed protein product [Paramecium octaurelia]
MNSWTLSFMDSNLESQFSHAQQKHVLRCQDRQRWLVIVILALLIVEQVLAEFWISVAIWGFSLGLLFISYRFRNQTKMIEKIFFITIIMLLAIYKQNSKFFDGISKEQFNIDSVLTTSATFCMIRNFKIVKQYLILMIIFMFNMVIQYRNVGVSALTILQNIIYIAMIIQHLYQKEQHRRINYIEDINQVNINQILFNQLNLQLFRVAYDMSACQLILLQRNLLSSINQEDQIEFNNQIRQIKISIKKNKRISEQIVLNQINQQMTLEQFLVLILNIKSSKLTQEVLNQNEYQLVGVLNYEDFQISIHRTFYIMPSVIILFKKNYKEHQIEELKLKRDTFKRGFDTIQDIFVTNIRPVLIYYTWIKQHSNIQKDASKIKVLHKIIQAKLYKAQHEYQNLKDFFQINKSFQKTIILSFSIDKIMSFIIDVVCDNLLNKKNLKIQFINKLQHKEINQDQAQFIQLFFNLLFFISEKSEDIKITIKDFQMPEIIHQILQVKIDYIGHPISRQFLQKLPIINPENLQDYIHNSTGTFSLDLPIALMIIRKLGPQDKLIWKQVNRGEISLEFYLYRNLPSDLHLLPVISLKPHKNIIYKSSQTRRKTLIYDHIYETVHLPAIQTDRELL